MRDTRRSDCPVACALELVGDRWTLLVLRDLFVGKQHFDELLDSDEHIATNVLSERLQRLLSAGLISVHVCAENKRRKRYELTELGRSFAPVLAAVASWGLRHIDGTVGSSRVRAALEREIAASKRKS
jgi:DNA-binding HxlR family transcriptional regulator